MTDMNSAYVWTRFAGASGADVPVESSTPDDGSGTGAIYAFDPTTPPAVGVRPVGDLRSQIVAENMIVIKHEVRIGCVQFSVKLHWINAVNLAYESAGVGQCSRICLNSAKRKIREQTCSDVFEPVLMYSS